jgi:hypothetical protein
MATGLARPRITQTTHGELVAIGGILHPVTRNGETASVMADPAPPQTGAADKRTGNR